MSKKKNKGAKNGINRQASRSSHPPKLDATDEGNPIPNGLHKGSVGIGGHRLSGSDGSSVPDASGKAEKAIHPKLEVLEKQSHSKESSNGTDGDNRDTDSLSVTSERTTRNVREDSSGRLLESCGREHGQGLEECDEASRGADGSTERIPEKLQKIIEANPELVGVIASSSEMVHRSGPFPDIGYLKEAKEFDPGLYEEIVGCASLNIRKPLEIQETIAESAKKLYNARAKKIESEAKEIRGRNYISWALVITGFILSLSAIPWPHMTNIVSITGSVSIIGGVINLALGGSILQKFKHNKE